MDQSTLIIVLALFTLGAFMVWGLLSRRKARKARRRD